MIVGSLQPSGIFYDDHGGMRLQHFCRDVVDILPTRLDMGVFNR